jgi:hypothetical protein
MNLRSKIMLGNSHFVIAPDAKLNIPSDLPLTIDFDDKKTIGTARVFKRGDEFRCEAQINEKLVEELHKKGILTGESIFDRIKKGFFNIDTEMKTGKMVEKDGSKIVKEAQLTEVSLVPREAEDGGDADEKA